MRRQTVVLGAAMAIVVAGVVVFTLLVQPKPHGEAATPPSSKTLGFEQVAKEHVIATELGLAAGHYTYWSQDATWTATTPGGWTSGFLPGELWLEYQRTHESWFKDHAISRELPLIEYHVDAREADIGFRYFYSAAKAYDVAHTDVDRRAALAAAAQQAARFVPTVGALRSRPGKDTCPVIVDEIMNAQLLFWGSDHGGPAKWHVMAHQHALTVARDFVRPSGSTYHVVEYDTATGHVRRKTTYQGYMAESTWARGQAWAIYGLSEAYRETRDVRLQNAAQRVADWYIAHLPEDHVPYWDFDAPDIPNSPRDSSAAAIAASGLLDLAQQSSDTQSAARYRKEARATLAVLSSPAFLSRGPNPAVLLHGTLNYRSQKTADYGLSFGDYFFLEALQRLRRLPADGPALWVKAVRASSGKPKRAVDGKPGTAWTSLGKQWLEFDLGRPRTVHELTLAVRYGTSRSAGFRVYVSTDRRRWHWADSARSSGETSDAETYAFKPKRARYVRISFSGTSVNHTNAISEAQLR